MSKEQEELLDGAYDNYWINAKYNKLDCFVQQEKEEFINKIKIDDEFAKQWGLTIEVRELSLEERFKIAYKNLELRKKLESESAMLHYPSGHSKVMDDANIPTRAISLTYNDKTIESYE